MLSHRVEPRQDLFESNTGTSILFISLYISFFRAVHVICVHTADAIYPTILVLFVVLFIVRLAECQEQFGKQSNRSAMEKNKLVHPLNSTELKSRSLLKIYYIICETRYDAAVKL